MDGCGRIRGPDTSESGGHTIYIRAVRKGARIGVMRQEGAKRKGIYHEGEWTDDMERGRR
jgi:hypothetical protein